MEMEKGELSFLSPFSLSFSLIFFFPSFPAILYSVF